MSTAAYTLIPSKKNDLDVFKVHVVAEIVDMACNFGSLVKTCHGLLCSAIRVFNDLSVWP